MVVFCFHIQCAIYAVLYLFKALTHRMLSKDFVSIYLKT